LGTVTGPKRLAVFGAAVTVTITATNVRQINRTDAGGIYSYPELAVGTYDIEVSASGFRASARISQLTQQHISRRHCRGPR